MKNDRLLEDIKARVDIFDLVSGYVQLKKAGQNWKGLCPFHAEKTPSFTVNQPKQIFHCFGCGTGGDVFAFVMKHDNVSFNEALRTLAKKAGVAMPDGNIDRKAVQRSEKIRNVLSDAGDYFQTQLRKSAKASEYMGRRGISAQSMDSFKVGYAPAGWSNLLRYLRDRDIPEKEIIEAGLAVTGGKGTYDMFRDRIMFPISNLSGSVIAFGGRAFDDAQPKYINSPETPVFRKSETLFGLYNAKEDIRRSNIVLLTEGYLDVIVCHQFGFRNAVAPLGTSLTPSHVQKIRTLAGRVVLVFDGDAAGKSAAKRAISLICQSNLKATVLILPDGEDPDSYLRKYGGQAFSGLLNQANTIISFIFNTASGEKLDTVRETLGLIASVNDLLLADEMLIELAGTTRIHEATLRDELRKVKKTGTAQLPRQTTGTARRTGNSEEYLLLSAVITDPSKADFVLSRIDTNELRDRTIASLFEKLSVMKDRRDLMRALEGSSDEERMLVTRLSVDPGFDPEYLDKNIEDCLKRIEERKFNEKSVLAEKSGDKELGQSLLIEKRKKC